jgi:nucleoside phosphorylase
MNGRLGFAKVGVLTIIDEEFDSTKSALGTEHRVPGRGYWRSEDAPERCVVCQSADRANLAAYEAVNDLLEHWRPEIVLVVGIAGGIPRADGPQLGDVVVPSYLHYAEFRKLTERQDAARHFAYDHPTVSLRRDHVRALIDNGTWLNAIDVDRPTSGAPESAPRVHVDPLVSVEKIMGNPKHPEQQRLVLEFDDAVAVDMESVGVGRAIHHHRTDPDYNPRFLVLRGISDLLVRVDEGERVGSGSILEVNNEERRVWKPYAAAGAAAFASALIDDICS